MRLLYASQSSFGGIKIGFLNVSIKRSPNVNKTFTQRFGNVIMLPKIDLVVKIGELLRFLSLSCFGKLFTSILSARLNKFLDAHTILEENQAGFRTGYSTMDHIFVLHALAEIAKSQKMKLFFSFIDFSKTFDSVWRVGLWKKLLASKINGKCFQIILNMYKGMKSCVSYNGEQSSLFSSFLGVRQGDNLCPVLFALFFKRLRIFPMRQKMQ